MLTTVVVCRSSELTTLVASFTVFRFCTASQTTVITLYARAS